MALLFGGDSTFGAFLAKQTEFILSNVSTSIIITYFFAAVGGSVVPAIMIYGLANFFSKTFPYQAMPLLLSTLRFQTVVEVSIAAAILVLTRGNLGLANATVADP